MSGSECSEIHDEMVRSVLRPTPPASLSDDVAGMLEHTAPLTGQVLRRYAADVDSGVPYDLAFERMGQRLR